MATCLSQLYHENKRGVKAGYAKFETFPIWNIPLKHPVNLAYEAATADLNDVNMIDPFHLEAYGETTVNYNRDIEIYPVLAAMFEGIYGHCPYKSPTDMGVNMAGNCIVDDEACQEASKQEIIRRYYQSVNRFVRDEATKDEVYKQELIMKQAKITVDDRAVVPVANKLAEETGSAAAALELPDGTIVTGSTSDLLTFISSPPECHQDTWRHRQEDTPDLKNIYRAYTEAQDSVPWQQESKTPHRRGSHRPVHVCSIRSKCQACSAAASKACRMPASHICHTVGG